MSPKSKSHKYKEKAILISLMLNTILFIPYLISYLLSNSITLESSVLKGASETFILLFAWMTIKKVSKGKTLSYNYGYGKLENVSNILLSLVMSFSALLIINHAFHRLLHPEPEKGEGILLGVVISIAAVLIDSYEWQHYKHVAKKDFSPLIEAKAKFFRSKTIKSSFILSSLFFTKLFNNLPWSYYIDPIGSLFISAFVLYSAYALVSESVTHLIDKTLEESLQLIILSSLTKYFDKYLDFHGIRSRKSGASIYIEIFLEFEGNNRMKEIQITINEIKKDLEDRIKGSHVIISPTDKNVNF